MGKSFPHNPWAPIAQTDAMKMYLSTGAGLLGRKGAFKNTLI